MQAMAKCMPNLYLLHAVNYGQIKILEQIQVNELMLSVGCMQYLHLHLVILFVMRLAAI